MKKIFLSLLIVFVVFGFAGCKKSAKKGDAVEVNDSKELVHLTEDMFRDMIFDYSDGQDFLSKNDNLVVIDFYADWCGPCKMYAPIFEEVAKNSSGDVSFYKVNVDKESVLASLFGINSIPSTVFIPANSDASKVYIELGILNAKKLSNKIDSLLIK